MCNCKGKPLWHKLNEVVSRTRNIYTDLKNLASPYKAALFANPKMEADSTTHDTNLKNGDCNTVLPFATTHCDLKLYREIINVNRERHIEIQIVEKLQKLGLLPKNVECLSPTPECKVVVKPARVIDRVQWICEGCGRRQPIRTGSIFLRIQCSLLQALQMILAWCKDADCETAAQHFGVKPKVATTIYDRMDDIAIKEQNKVKLGGENSVVLTEMYPDCLTRLSPDTTDHPHMHRVLMVADTNYVPTSYQLHVVKDDLRKNSTSSLDSQSLIEEVAEVLSRVTVGGCTVVAGAHTPPLPAAATIHQLLQHCDCEMQHFLSTRIWRGAVSLCAASRDLCAGAASAACANLVQRYLSAALYRHRIGDQLFANMLDVIAQHYTQQSGTKQQGKQSLGSAVTQQSTIAQLNVVQSSATAQGSLVIERGAVSHVSVVTQRNSVTQDSVIMQRKENIKMEVTDDCNAADFQVVAPQETISPANTESSM